MNIIKIFKTLNILIILTLFLSACSGVGQRSGFNRQSGRTTQKGLPVKKGNQNEGVISYYGKKFHGRKTANGETFNMHKMTAAHRTFPFNTRVKVTLHATGKSVVVRINDRGPFKKNRILDLSYGAAKKIGLLEGGTGKATLKVL